VDVYIRAVAEVLVRVEGAGLGKHKGGFIADLDLETPFMRDAVIVPAILPSATLQDRGCIPCGSIDPGDKNGFKKFVIRLGE